MKKLTDRINASIRPSRRRDLQVWGDARALPYTEGQAVVAAGRIGPAQFPIVKDRAA